jgi:hypothetical protein
MEDGTIYSRRMVKDERLRNARAEAGKLGGNPNLVNHLVNLQVNHVDNYPSKQKPTPSSSSSSSSSNGLQRTNEDARDGPPEHHSANMALKVNGNSKKPPAGWHRTPEGIDQAGRLLGIPAKRGEEYDSYKARIFEFLNVAQSH